MQLTKIDDHKFLSGIVLGFWRESPSLRRFAIGADFMVRVLFGEPVLVLFNPCTSEWYLAEQFILCV